MNIEIFMIDAIYGIVWKGSCTLRHSTYKTYILKPDAVLEYLYISTYGILKL